MVDSITRRNVVVTAAAGAGLAAASSSIVGQAGAQQPTPAKTFVLLHGAWHGGWCWRRVSDRLEAKGHKVFSPTLTGVGERSHLLSKDINLDTVPENGDSLVEKASQAARDGIMNTVKSGEPGMKPIPAAVFRVNEKDRAWVDSMCTPQPIATMTDKASVTGGRDKIAKRAYIRAKGYPSVPFDAAQEKLKASAGWKVYEMPCGHDAMVDMPDRLSEILIEVA